MMGQFSVGEYLAVKVIGSLMSIDDLDDATTEV
jgi:hypothetical protein